MDDKIINLTEIHNRLAKYASLLNVSPEALQIDIQVWGHWDAAFPVIRLYSLTQSDKIELTQDKTLYSLAELDNFVDDLASHINK